MEDLELDDAELLASLDADEVEMLPAEPVQDSGYGTMRMTPTQSSRSSSVRSFVSAASSRWVVNGVITFRSYNFSLYTEGQIYL